MISGAELIDLAKYLLPGIMLLVWFFVPFAIYGTKPKLDELINAVTEIDREVGELNRKLASLQREMRTILGETQAIERDIRLQSGESDIT
jgi:hypothetical protein